MNRQIQIPTDKVRYKLNKISDEGTNFDFMLSGKSEKKSTKVRSRMEGAGNFFKIVAKTIDCYGFCV